MSTDSSFSKKVKLNSEDQDSYVSDTEEKINDQSGDEII